MKLAVLVTRSLRGSGFATRVVSMLQSYSAFGYEVDLFHYRRPHDVELPTPALSHVRDYIEIPLERARLRRHCSVIPPIAWQCARAHARHVQTSRRYDVIQAETSSTWAAARMITGDARIVSLHDDDAVRLHQLSKIAPDMAHRAAAVLDARKFSRWQRMAFNEADRIWFASGADRDRLGVGPLAGKSRVIPNGASDHLWSLPLRNASSATVLFVGPGFYAANVHGVEWFLRQVWPLVRGSVSGARLRIVGVAWDGFQESEGVSFPGWCPSLADEYAQAGVCIAPLFGGGGTKLKVVESMAAARPVVTTPIGAEGLPESEGMRVCLEPVRFAAGVATFLADPDAACSAGVANRAAVEDLRWSRVWGRAAMDLVQLVGPRR